MFYFIILIVIIIIVIFLIYLNYNTEILYNYIDISQQLLKESNFEILDFEVRNSKSQSSNFTLFGKNIIYLGKKDINILIKHLSDLYSKINGVCKYETLESLKYSAIKLGFINL